MAWTEHRIEKLKELWAQGKSGGQIAEELGGVSRNGVVGKAHRLGLERRPNPADNPERFARICDRVIDEDPTLSIHDAAIAEGLDPGLAQRFWDQQIGKTHAGPSGVDPAEAMARYRRLQGAAL